MLSTIVLRLILTFSILSLIFIGVFDYLENIDENDCTMTYMRPPVYIPINQGKQIQLKYPRYKLYLHCGTDYCDMRQDVKFTTHGNIPVLFITGNADSHSVVRSISSVALAKAQQPKYASRNINFNYFTISFNEELSALYGPVLESQTKFVQQSIKHILTLYKSIEPEYKRPKHVLLVANSMGGLLAKAIFINSDLHNYVHTIITTASPHRRPVVNFDYSIHKFYKSIDNYWKTSDNLKNIVLVSLSGGNRDILVRSGLVEFDSNLFNETKAYIISKTTTSVPFVWRSIDHKCMSWCKELVLVTNRALFQMIDTKTQFLIEDKQKRINILSSFYVKEIQSENNEKLRTNFPSESLVFLKERDEFNLDINEYNPDKEKVFVLDLDSVDETKNGLFIYSNLNRFQSFLGCKELRFNEVSDSYDCLEPEDLFTNHGQSIPPNELGRDIGLKTINIESLNEFKTKHRYVMVILPQWKKSKLLYHQPIIKFDWYSNRERFIETQLSNFATKSIELSSNGKNFFRIYLFGFSTIQQSFQVNLITGDCDSALRNNRNLLSSCVQLKFNEKSGKFYYSQITNLKSNNFTLRLAENINDNPYLDVIIFDFKHLTNGKQEIKNSKIQIEFKPNYLSILGQYIRFYSVLIPAFLVALLQISFLNDKNESNKHEKDSLLVLHENITQYKTHLVTCFLMTVITILNINYFSIESDFELLNFENIFTISSIPILYASSLAILSLITLIFSALIKLVLLVFNQILVLIFSNIFSNRSVMGKLIFLIHYLTIITGSFYCSTLAHCFVFYSELLYLLSKIAYNKKNNINNSNQLRKSFISLFLMYLLIVLKLPALIVWSKSLQFYTNMKPLSLIIGDPDFPYALISVIIYLVNYLKRNYSSFRKILKINRKILNIFICFNILGTIFYSCLSLHLLSVFIIVYLVSTIFDNEEEHEDKPKKD